MHSTHSVRQATSGGSENLQRTAQAVRATRCSPRHPTTEPGPIVAYAAHTRPTAGEVRNG
jgi:hypothetical protein